MVIILLFLLNGKLISQKIDEFEGSEGFLANMGYPKECIPMTDQILNYADYDTYDSTGKDILVIINYNFPHYKNNDFIKQLYNPYFPNIVFYGPTEHPEIHQYNANSGIFGYMAIALAMEKYPNYAGYLFVEDDCVMNLWNYVRFDKTKIWMADHNSRRIFDFNEHAKWSHWNNASWGSVAAKKAYKKLPKKYFKMLVKNCGGPNKAMGGMSDIVYFPAKYKNDVIQLCKLFLNENVFIEITIPTIACCLDNIYNCESLHGRSCYLRPYNTYLDFVHPVKFSSENNRLLTQQQFKNVLEKITACAAKA